MSVSIRFATTSEDFDNWNDLVKEAPGTSFYVTTSWLNSYRVFGLQTKYLVATRADNEFIGGAALMDFRFGPIRWLYVPHGPFARENGPEVIPELLDAIESCAAEIGAIFIQIAPFERSEYRDEWARIAEEASLPYSPDLPAAATCRVSEYLISRGYEQKSYYRLIGPGSSGQIVDLRVEDILRTFRKRGGQYIRRTLDSEDVRVKEAKSKEDLATAYRIIRENTNRYGQTYRSWSNFMSAVWPGIESDHMLVLTGYYESEPCAVILVGFGGRIASYISGGIRRGIDYSGLQPAYLLQYVAMEETKKRGFLEYDLTALVGGGVAQGLQAAGSTPLESYRAIVIGYALFGVALALLFNRLSSAIEVTTSPQPAVTPSRLGLHHSRGIVLKLSGLFALDAFAGGFVVQSLVAYWFHVRFGVEPAVLGSIFFGANVLAGISALLAARVAARIGLINTMVVTHIPSNILLMLVPLMPNLPLAIAMLFLRFSISQMDVPTRQSYTMAMVDPDERSAASGVTTIARSIGAALSPSIAGALLSASLISVPFFLSGGIKIVYDLTLYFSFRAMKPPEEQRLSTQ